MPCCDPKPNFQGDDSRKITAECQSGTSGRRTCSTSVSLLQVACWFQAQLPHECLDSYRYLKEWTDKRCACERKPAMYNARSHRCPSCSSSIPLRTKLTSNVHVNFQKMQMNADDMKMGRCQKYLKCKWKHRGNKGGQKHTVWRQDCRVEYRHHV